MTEVPPTPPGPREQRIHATEVAVEQGPLARSSWGAILAGAVCGLAIYLVLGIIGLAVGIGAIDPAEEAEPLAGVPFGLGVWWTLSAIAAFFTGGAIAGRLAGFPKDVAGALNGLTVGALAVLMIAYVATTAAGSAVTGAAGAVATLFREDAGQKINITLNRQPQRAVQPDGQGGGRQEIASSVSNAGARAPAAARAQQTFAMNERIRGIVATLIAAEARSLYNSAVTDAEQRRAMNRIEATFADVIETPSDAREDVRALVQFLLSKEGVLSPKDRRAAKRMLIDQMGLNEADADRILKQWQERYQAAVGEFQDLVNETSSELDSYLKSNGRNITRAMEMPDAVRRVVSRQQQRRTASIVSNTATAVWEDPENSYGELQIMIEKLFGQNGVWSEEDLKELRTVLRDQVGLSQQQVDRLVDRWQQRYQRAVRAVEASWEEVKTTTAEAADATADRIASAAGWTALALFLALAASAAGGMMGRPDDRFAVPDTAWARRMQERARTLGRGES
jgi:hypothetical protein